GLLCSALLLSGCSQYGEDDGISQTTIRLGSVLALRGPAKGLGTNMRDGMLAALDGRKVGGRTVRLVSKNDYYEPDTAAAETRSLIDSSIMLMVGNVGTPTAKVTLPILKDASVPAVGFFTGAGILRPGSGGPILNFRASYKEEVAAVIEAAVSQGIRSSEICAYVQNDSYGMAGLAGIKDAMTRANAPARIIKSYDQILGMVTINPPRNDIGPVGVYTRNTHNILDGYQSLKNWEIRTRTRCRLIVTVGAYANIANFIRHAAENERWIVSVVSFTGADNLAGSLAEFGTTRRVLMTQVVPLLDSDMPIVREAKQQLGDNFGFVSLEGYVVGKMILRLLQGTEPPLTRERFIQTARSARFNLGGLAIDFTRDSNQGSDLVVLSHLRESGWQEMNDRVWRSMIQE
ncbi:MAG: ABC transporter substrate-binding protein, partial [Gammaproteobacteria bacterium]